MASLKDSEKMMGSTKVTENWHPCKHRSNCLPQKTQTTFHRRQNMLDFLHVSESWNPYKSKRYLSSLSQKDNLKPIRNKCRCLGLFYLHP